MAKNVKVTKEQPSGRNTGFKAPNKPEMTRPEFVKQIKQDKFPDYHVRTINDIPTPCSNPDNSKGNNLG